MRELKFRAYDTIDKKWLFGYDYGNLGGFSLIGEVVLFGQLNQVSLERWNDVSIMQYTGLTNNDNVQVYEGDLIEHYDGQICEVVFGKKTLGFGYHYQYKTNWNTVDKFYRLDKKVKVIGNKYQNPELLNP